MIIQSQIDSLSIYQNHEHQNHLSKDKLIMDFIQVNLVRIF